NSIGSAQGPKRCAGCFTRGNGVRSGEKRKSVVSYFFIVTAKRLLCENTQKGALMQITRREAGKMAVAASSASRLLAETNSKFGGVQIGINAPYSFHGAYNTAEECLEAMVKLNLSSVELRAQPIERFMGAPPDLVAYPPRRRGAGQGRGPGAGGPNAPAAI